MNDETDTTFVYHDSGDYLGRLTGIDGIIVHFDGPRTRDSISVSIATIYEVEFRSEGPNDNEECEGTTMRRRQPLPTERPDPDGPWVARRVNGLGQVRWQPCWEDLVFARAGGFSRWMWESDANWHGNGPAVYRSRRRAEKVAYRKARYEAARTWDGDNT